MGQCQTQPVDIEEDLEKLKEALSKKASFLRNILTFTCSILYVFICTFMYLHLFASRTTDMVTDLQSCGLGIGTGEPIRINNLPSSSIQGDSNLAIVTREIFITALDLAKKTNTSDAWTYIINTNVPLSYVSIINLLFLKLSPEISVGVAMTSLSVILSLVCSFLCIAVLSEAARTFVASILLLFARYLFFVDKDRDRDICQLLSGCLVTVAMIYVFSSLHYICTWKGDKYKYKTKATAKAAENDFYAFCLGFPDYYQYLCYVVLCMIVSVSIHYIVPFAPLIMVSHIMSLELLHLIIVGRSVLKSSQTISISLLSDLLKISYGGLLFLTFAHLDKADVPFFIGNNMKNVAFPSVTNVNFWSEWLGMFIMALSVVFGLNYGTFMEVKFNEYLFYLLKVVILVLATLHGIKTQNEPMYVVSIFFVGCLSATFPLMAKFPASWRDQDRICIGYCVSLAVTVIMSTKSTYTGSVDIVGFVCENLLYTFSGPLCIFINTVCSLLNEKPYGTFSMNLFVLYLAIETKRSALLFTTVLCIAGFVWYLGYRVFKFDPIFIFLLALTSVGIIFWVPYLVDTNTLK